MQKKALVLSLLAASAGSVAAVAGVAPVNVARLLPAAAQGVAMPAPRLQAQPGPPTAGYGVSPAVADSLARWNSLRQSDSYPFSSYASFLLADRGWPGETGLRKSAEKAIDSTASPLAVISYFRVLPPLTNTGQAKLAFALLATGRRDEALEAARAAWTGGVLARPDEDRLLTLFGGGFSSGDHDRRMEALLANRDVQSAQRTLPLASPAQRVLFDARLALQTRAPDASVKLALAGPGYAGHAGLLMDRATSLRNSGQALAARQLLAQRPPLSAPPANAENWLETLLTLAREAANDRQWTTAYDIAARIDDTYPAGTDVSGRPYAERDAYTSLVFLAGSAALDKLGRPADAMRMFERYARAARSMQTRAKGFYWAARAAHGAGEAQQSQAFLEQAAVAPDQFYGQLALERLGRPVAAPPPPTLLMPSPAERSAFESRSLVQATRALGLMGRWSDQTLFVRVLAQQLETDDERRLAADFGRQIGRLDLGVWLAREARNKGGNFYSRLSFPQVPIAPVFARHQTLAHAITRQESSFDRQAVSNAGARGMMQLMPGTARETAGKLGLAYEPGRLTSDPSYNMMLGTAYFSTLLDQWGGSVPLAVASYNAGTGNVRRWLAQNGDPRAGGDMVRWIEQIPFSETRNYVQRVLENAVVYDAMSGGGASPRTYRLSYYLGKSGPG